MMPVRIELIKNCSLLDGLTDTVLIDISHQASYLSVKSGTTMFDCGNSCKVLPLILSGSIRVFKRSEIGREISLYRVNKDQLCIITLGCLLGGDIYPANGITENDITGITLPRTLFLNLVATQPKFREKAFHLFAERLSGLMQLIDEVTFHKLDQRLASYLVQRDPIIVESHQQIADELGSVREIISRLLKHFEDQHWLKLARKKIEITNLKALKEFSG